jgi:hypothetical protein
MITWTPGWEVDARSMGSMDGQSLVPPSSTYNATEPKNWPSMGQ